LLVTVLRRPANGMHLTAWIRCLISRLFVTGLPHPELFIGLHGVACHVHDPVVVMPTSFLSPSKVCCPQALVWRLGSSPTMRSSWRAVLDLSVVDITLRTGIGLDVFLFWSLIRVASVSLYCSSSSSYG
jgi:hypothetical protein